MGACNFTSWVPRKSKHGGFNERFVGRTKYLDAFQIDATAEEAFMAARDNAAHDHGHAGYTGTIAEKHEWVGIDKVKTLREAKLIADTMIEEDDPRICDKWGPAGMIEVTGEGDDDGFLFFGWASS